MKRFRFTLSRLLEIRARELEAAQLRVRELRGRRESLRAEAERLEAEGRQVSAETLAQTVLTGHDLAMANGYRMALDSRRRRTIQTARQLEGDERAALRQTVEAHRKVRLLEILESRQRQAHRRTAEREQEALASELFLARFERPAGLQRQAIPAQGPTPELAHRARG